MLTKIQIILGHWVTSNIDHYGVVVSKPEVPKGAYIRSEDVSSSSEKMGLKWKIYIPGHLYGEIDGDDLLAIRKEQIALRDECLALQKKYGKDDRELAKYYSNEAREALKVYRAVCMLIPYWVANPSKDCPVVHRLDWPIELSEQFTYVLNEAQVRGWKRNAG